MWDGSTVVLYIVEHLECETGVQQFYIIIEEHLERGTGVQQFYIAVLPSNTPDAPLYIELLYSRPTLQMLHYI